jgi:magnesium transporter
LLAIPVVDADDRLVGIVTYDDVIDVVVSEATEDVHRMGAVGPMTENYLEAGFVTIWRKRAIWLACLFVAELFTFSALAYFEDAIAAVVVLSLFVPLCISTGGNSGSQAATLITRAMALGQVGGKDWWRVFRHELAMGIVLGLTLGVIGLVRASFTPESVRSSSPQRPEPFRVVLSRDQELRPREQDNQQVVLLPTGTSQTMVEEHPVEVTLPEGETVQRIEDPKDPNSVIYLFPAKCTVRHPAVPRWSLALVIGLAVCVICLWGTLVGSMLPFAFRRIGVDPGIASSPFVATAVDVTGIVFYFTIAKIVLWQMFVS